MTIRCTTPPRQILSSLHPNTPHKRARSIDQGDRAQELSELRLPARYHHPDSMAHWSRKNQKSMSGKTVHTMATADSPEKEIEEIVKHVRASAHLCAPFDLSSGHQVQWEGSGFGVYAGGLKIRQWGVHRSQDGRWISFPIEGRNLVVFKKDSSLTPAHLADWSQEIQQSGVDPTSFVRRKLFLPDGNSTQNTDGNQIDCNHDIQ